MHTNLTVEENLLFSARIRLPAHYSHAQHVFHVERAIQVSLYSSASLMTCLGWQVEVACHSFSLGIDGRKLQDLQC